MSSDHHPAPASSPKQPGRTPPARPILVIEADDQLGHATVDQLLAERYTVRLARSANHATILATHAPPALVLLGTLDAADGALALLRMIRASTPRSPWQPDVPVIVLSPDRTETELLRAFAAGADDYLGSPPSYPELRARVRALLRRTVSPDNRHVLQVGPLRIDTSARTATLHGQDLDLRPMEYNLLAHLAREPTRVYRPAELLRSVWGYPEPCRTRTLDTHAGRLRHKLNTSGGRWVINVRGVGYRLT